MQTTNITVKINKALHYLFSIGANHNCILLNECKTINEVMDCISKFTFVTNESARIVKELHNWYCITESIYRLPDGTYFKCKVYRDADTFQIATSPNCDYDVPIEEVLDSIHGIDPANYYDGYNNFY